MSADSQPSESSKRTQLLAQVIDQLACPKCLSSLQLEETTMVCTGCGRHYPVHDGIPKLIPGA